MLERQGIEKLDYLIVTHFDQDHVGGAAKVLNNFPVETVLQSNCPKDSTEYEKYQKALNNASLTAQTVTETLTFTLDGVSYTIDPPRGGYEEDESNNSSLIVSVVNGGDSLLFLGDAQTERLAEFLSGSVSHYDLLKVPHHGQEEPGLEELLAAVTPQYAVITSSEEEPESESTVNTLESAGAEVWLTRTAAILIESRGDGLTLSYQE